MNSKELLKIYWGHDTFRPLQEEIIDSVMLSRDTLALLPTGGGKSYCYQIPALMREGFALVISPLIALMEDQVTNLQNKGIKAMYFESDSQGLRLSQQIDNAINGNFKVVYVSPERLLNPSFKFSKKDIGHLLPGCIYFIYIISIFIYDKFIYGDYYFY